MFINAKKIILFINFKNIAFCFFIVHFEIFAFMFRQIYYLIIYKKFEMLFINKILIIIQ
jgi:hypothetical protein